MIFFLQSFLRRGLLLLLLLGWVLPEAATAAPPVGALPAALGRIVYQQRGDSPFQVYIVANSHRSCATGANGSVTVQAQAGTFRIGAWLIGRKKIDMLLPEGFFGRLAPTPVDAGKGYRLPPSRLRQELADTSHFVNAELLLHRRFGIGLYQVEDPRLYRQARSLLLTGLQSGACLSPTFDGDLAYLQERRLAAMLQNIPAAMDSAWRRGQLPAPRAMFTIGLAHLPDLLQMLRSGEIVIPAPPHGAATYPPFRAPLALHGSKVGVTVIVPRPLLKNLPRQRTACRPFAAPLLSDTGN